VLLNYLVSPQYNERALERVETGAKKVGRTLEEIDRPQLVVVSVDHNHQKALDNARELVTQYLGQQPHIMKASGVSEDLLNEIHRVLKLGSDWSAGRCSRRDDDPDRPPRLAELHRRFAGHAGDRIVFMDDGLVLEEGNPRELFANPSHERTRGFLAKIL